MKIIRGAAKTFILASALILPAALWAQSDAQQTERLQGPGAHVSRMAVAPAKDGAFSVPVVVDLRGLTIAGRPAELGAYVARITFDPHKVLFIDVKGGENPKFAEAPVFTNAKKVNAGGELRVVGSQPGSTGATGLVNVATAHFRELVAGGSTTIKVTLMNAASAQQLGESGDFGNFKLPIEGRE